MFTAQRGPGPRIPEKPNAEVNRRLIRPSLNEVKEQMQNRPPRKKPTPPEQTNAENFYYVKQMQSRTPMVVVLQDGENIHGIIEWYDKYCIKVNRIGAANLLIYKSNIKYLYKESEARGVKEE
jgi:host factor-I protein